MEDERIKLIADKIKQLRIKAGYSSHENFAWEHELSRVQYWRECREWYQYYIENTT